MSNKYLHLNKLEYYSALDDDFIVGLLRSYLSNIQGYKVAILNSYQTQDLTRLKTDSHALLSSARALFFFPLVWNLQNSEGECTAGAPSELANRIALLEVQINECNKEIEQFLQTNKT
jgi:hypothetical protein